MWAWVHGERWEAESKWFAVNRSWSLCAFCVFSMNAQKGFNVNPKGLWTNCLQLIKWHTMTNCSQINKKRYFCNTMTYYFIFLYTLILHFKLLYLNFYFFSFLLSWYFKVKDYLLWREGRVYSFLGTVNVYYNFSHHYCYYMYSEDLKIIFEKCSFAFFIIYFNFGIF